MLIYKGMAEELMQKLKNGLFNELYGKLDLLGTLDNENDWGFVIKSHAMIEAATTEMIVNHLGSEDLTKVIERLPLSDSQCGKLVIAKSLNLLGEKERQFARSYSELRNSLVHRVENLNFTFENHLASLQNAKRGAWLESICWFCNDEDTLKKWKKVASQSPRHALHLGIFEYMSMCVVVQSAAIGKRKIDSASEITMSSLLKNGDSRT